MKAISDLGVADLMIMTIIVIVMNTHMIFFELMVVFIMLITRPDDETRGDETPSA